MDARCGANWSTSARVGDELRDAVGQCKRSARRRGAYRGGVARDTGEGGISPNHLRGGGDLIWEVGSGYFGCRDADGRFDPATFAEKAALRRLSGGKPVGFALCVGARTEFLSICNGLLDTGVTADFVSSTVPRAELARPHRNSRIT